VLLQTLERIRAGRPCTGLCTACGPRAGDFKGQSMHFSGGDATFEANPGVLIGKGSASGRRFTCYGEGTFQVPQPGRPCPVLRHVTAAPWQDAHSRFVTCAGNERLHFRH